MREVCFVLLLKQNNDFYYENMQHDRVFCSVFLLSFGQMFHRCWTSWNHANINSIREWHTHQENHEIDSRVPSGLALGDILDNCWDDFRIIWTIWTNKLILWNEPPGVMCQQLRNGCGCEGLLNLECVSCWLTKVPNTVTEFQHLGQR